MKHALTQMQSRSAVIYGAPSRLRGISATVQQTGFQSDIHNEENSNAVCPRSLVHISYSYINLGNTSWTNSMNKKHEWKVTPLYVLNTVWRIFNITI